VPYCTVDDLLLGDFQVGKRFDKQQFVDGAADEIDSKLGWLYETPLVAANGGGFGALPRHQRLLVTGINLKLASGRLILATAIGGEDNSLHAYGNDLVKQATAELLLIANGDVSLDADRPGTGSPAPDDRGPKLNNEDEESLLLGFTNTVMRNEPWWSQPGKVT
jgi:hypothetical protein